MLFDKVLGTTTQAPMPAGISGQLQPSVATESPRMDRQRLRDICLMAYEMCGTIERLGLQPHEYGEFQNSLQRFWYAKK